MNIDKLIEETRKINYDRWRIEKLVNKHNDIIIIGNGGSNSVASHITQD